MSGFHYIGAGREVASSDRLTRAVSHAIQADRLAQYTHLDPIPHQEPCELGDESRVTFGGDQVAPYALASVLDRRPVRLVVFAEQCLALCGRGLYGGPGGQIVPLEGVGQRSYGTIRAGEGESAARALLVEHPDGTLIAAIRGGVSGIEVVVALPGHVFESRRVESGGVRLTEANQPGRSELGEERSVGVGCGIEVELHVGAHLMGVDHHLRPPRLDRWHTRLRLALRVGEPVAVAVEVVVPGSELERLPASEVVGPVVALGVGDSTDVLVIQVRESVPPVGVEHRVDEDDGVL